MQKELGKPIKSLLMILIIMGLSFLRERNVLLRLKQKTAFLFNVCVHENRLVFPIYISDQKCENSIDLLLVINENKSNYVYIKDFDRFMLQKQRIKTKFIFARVVYSALVVKMY